jgi:hypothetical protein
MCVFKFSNETVIFNQTEINKYLSNSKIFCIIPLIYSFIHQDTNIMPGNMMTDYNMNDFPKLNNLTCLVIFINTYL